MRRGRWLPVLILTVWIICLNACSVRLTSPADFPDPVRLHEVAPYKQEPSRCGPYALAAVLEHFGKEADPEEISQRIYSPGARGVLTMDLYLEASRSGLEVQQVRGDLEGLYGEIKTGSPAIVLLKYPVPGRTSGHFVVITGCSDEPAGVFLLWGDGRLSWINEKRFLDLWSPSGFWVLFFAESGR